MHCPHCNANDYEVRLIERDDVYTGPLTTEAVIAINLVTDGSEAARLDDMVNTLVTCRKCGSWFMKAAAEDIQTAYARHCSGET